MRFTYNYCMCIRQKLCFEFQVSPLGGRQALNFAKLEPKILEYAYRLSRFPSKQLNCVITYSQHHPQGLSFNYNTSPFASQSPCLCKQLFRHPIKDRSCVLSFKCLLMGISSTILSWDFQSWVSKNSCTCWAPGSCSHTHKF